MKNKEIEKILLQKIKFEFGRAISDSELNLAFDVDSYTTQMSKLISKEIVYKIKTEIFGEKHKVKIYAPKNWFQMFKKQYFPNWLLKKFPVQNKELGILELYQLYPEIKASLPNEKHYLHLAQFEYKKDKY